MTEIELCDIPEDWEIEKDFLKIKSGFGFKLKEYTESGVPLIRIDNVGYGKITDENLCYLSKSYLEKYKNFTLKKGDILLALNRPITNNQLKIGKVNTEPAILYQRVGCIKSINDSFLLDFYYFYLQSPICIKKLSSILVGSDQPYIKSSEFSKIYFPKPPIKEQNKIASILSIVDDLIENTSHLINSYTLLKKGLMQTLLTKGIGHTDYKMSEVGEIPVDWKVKTLEEIAEKRKYSIVDGPFGSNLKSIDYTKDGILVIQGNYLTSGKFNIISPKYISNKKCEELKRSQVKSGDILISKIGACGFCEILPNYINEAVLSSNCMKITVDKHVAINSFYMYLIKLYKQKGVLDNLITTTAQPSLTLKVIKKLKVPLPPIEEQKIIVSILSLVDSRIDIYKSKKEKLNLLKKGLMQQLLTGKIRVKV